MRVVAMADCHIDHGHGGLDAKGAWRAAWKYVADTKPNLAIVAGDLFQSGKPTAAAINYAGAGFNTATKAGVPVLVIAGNHEWIGVERESRNPLPIDVFVSYPGVWVAKTPKLLKISDDLVVAAVPWISPDCDLEQTLKLLNQFASQLAQIDTPRILAGHAFIGGGERGSELELIARLTDEPNIPLPLIDRPDVFGHSVLGHIHNRQNLSPTCSYVGSTDRLTFADEGRARGISDFTWDASTRRWQETLVPVAQHHFRTYTVGVDTYPTENLEDIQIRVVVPHDAAEADVEMFKARIVEGGGAIRYHKREENPNERLVEEPIDDTPLKLLDAVGEWCSREELTEAESAGVTGQVNETIETMVR